MMYRCEATTATGFVQQLACGYLQHGYHWYVLGELPDKKDPLDIDARFIERYGLGITRWDRARRKRAGLANVQYIRYRRFFVLCATQGEHRFYEEHTRQQIRHIKDRPISFAGYSIGYHRGVDRKWHVSVRIHPRRYRSIKAHLLDVSTKRNVDSLRSEFESLKFEPYAPVRRQLIALLRGVNRERKTKGWAPVPFETLRLRRQIVRPFGFDEPKQNNQSEEAA